MKVKFKRYHKDARIPKKAYDKDLRLLKLK